MKMKTVLTNGVVELEVRCNRYGASVDVRDHILAQDGKGQYYVDGIKAHLLTKIDEDPEWESIIKELK